jgi:hypothetical protein
LIAWKLEHRLLDPLKHRHYGVHYTDPAPRSRRTITSSSVCRSTATWRPMQSASSTGSFHEAGVRSRP